MSWQVRLALSSILLLSIALTGCMGSGVNIAGPINGPFSNSSLNGSYAFSFSGVNQNGFLAVAGSFQANGSGAITGGTIDISSAGGIFTNQSLTGAYNVRNNGQATATLTAAAGTFDIDFVLTSGQHALIIRFDNNSTASGSIDLQSSSAFSLAALAGSFTFNLSGIDVAGNTEASVGNFTVDSSGNISSGVQDTNDNGTVSANVALTPTSPAMSNPSNGRGTLTITGGSTLHFVYYVVSASELKVVEVDSSPLLAGAAFRQTGTAVSGSFAFTLGGSSNNLPFVAGGIINTDGAGNVLSTSVEDQNDGGSISQNIALTGTYSVAANGRGAMTLNSGAINLVIYPSASGAQVLEIDTATTASGGAFQQSGTLSNASISGNYGLNFTGVTPSAEIDSVGQFAADGSGNFSGGALDANNGGTLSSNLKLTGAYTVSPDGHGTGTLQSSLGAQSVAFYVVNSTRVLFIEVDSAVVAVGEMDHQ